MNQVSEYGNTPWIIYVAAAYLVVGVVLAGYTVFCYRNRRQSLLALKSEGFFADSGRETQSGAVGLSPTQGGQ